MADARRGTVGEGEPLGRRAKAPAETAEGARTDAGSRARPAGKTSISNEKIFLHFFLLLPGLLDVLEISMFSFY